MRVKLPDITQSTGGVVLIPLAFATVAVNVRNGGAATVYASETGAALGSNILTTDMVGRLAGWVDEGSYDLVISGNALIGWTEPFEAIAGASSIGGKELAAASNYFTGSQFGDATGSYVDVTGLDTGVFTVGTRPIVVEFSCLYTYMSASGVEGQLQLWDVTNSEDRGAVLTTVSTGTNQVAAFSAPPRWRLPSLAAGSYQFRMRWKKAAGTGTAYLVSSVSGTAANKLTPAQMRVVEG